VDLTSFLHGSSYTRMEGCTHHDVTELNSQVHFLRWVILRQGSWILFQVLIDEWQVPSLFYIKCVCAAY
jgi:hypothetical protein